MQAKRSTKFVKKLKAHMGNGTLPKHLLVKPPKLSINDAESNVALSTIFESIQLQANKEILKALTEAMENVATNHAFVDERTYDDFYNRRMIGRGF